MRSKDNLAAEFRALEIPKRDVSSHYVPKYLVYSDEKNFIAVEAENAQVALEKSGVKNPYRIVFDSMLRKNILRFTPSDAPESGTKEEMNGAVLSPNDVENLLKNDNVNEP